MFHLAVRDLRSQAVVGLNDLMVVGGGGGSVWLAICLLHLSSHSLLKEGPVPLAVL